MANVTGSWHWYGEGMATWLSSHSGPMGAGHTLKVALYHSNSNAESGRKWINGKNDITGTVTGGNYVDGTVSSYSVSASSGAQKMQLRISDSITFGTNLTASAKYAVLYDDDSADYPIAVCTFASVLSATDGSITLNQDGNMNAILTFDY